MANILAIQEKVIRLIIEQNAQFSRLSASSFLQHAQSGGLDWSDSELSAFLQGTIGRKFGVQVSKKNIKMTMNGSSVTIGDLAIAIFLAMERQQKTGSVILGQTPTMSA